MQYKKPLKFVVSISISLIAGMIGSIFTSTSVDTWYRTLKKPIFNPPDWVFAPVWTFLYIIIGFSLFLVCSDEGTSYKTKNTSLTFFSLQLLFNILWSLLFFGMKNPLLAFVDIILLWSSIILTMIFFKKISLIAFVLFIPYILWVTFAIFLNYAILVMN
ncbi:MAG: tryptophan-rich sensory protein [bacterium]|nr:tryptophan-rich sensory protein [bacterium]